MITAVARTATPALAAVAVVLISGLSALGQLSDARLRHATAMQLERPVLPMGLVSLDCDAELCTATYADRAQRQVPVTDEWKKVVALAPAHYNHLRVEPSPWVYRLATDAPLLVKVSPSIPATEGTVAAYKTLLDRLKKA